VTLTFHVTCSTCRNKYEYTALSPSPRFLPLSLYDWWLPKYSIYSMIRYLLQSYISLVISFLKTCCHNAQRMLTTNYFNDYSYFSYVPLLRRVTTTNCFSDYSYFSYAPLLRRVTSSIITSIYGAYEPDHPQFAMEGVEARERVTACRIKGGWLDCWLVESLHFTSFFS
jgi:hypothetical protein